MKIGVLVGQLTQLGGVGITAVEEVKNFNRLGYDSELLVLKEKRKFSYSDFTEGIPIRWLSREYPWIYKLNFRIPFFSFFSLFHLISPYIAARIIKQKEYDFIICHETYNCFTALRLSWKLNLPYLLFMWDPISYILPRVYARRTLRFAFPFFIPLARFFDIKFTASSLKTITCSKAHVSFLLELTGQSNKIETVYPGCYPQERIKDKRKDYILALTKWDLGKNPVFLLEVLKKIKNKNSKLIIAGNWTQAYVYEEFVKKAKAYNLINRIEITGRADNEAKSKFFQEARVLIHPIFEAFGMMCLEAASFGCPFIVPRGSGVTELFEHGVQGFFPEEGDIDSYVKYIDILLEDERFAYDMGYKAWQVAKKYTWMEHAKKLVNIIESEQRKEKG